MSFTPAFFALLVVSWILTTVPCNACINVLVVNIKIELIPLGAFIHTDVYINVLKNAPLSTLCAILCTVSITYSMCWRN